MNLGVRWQGMQRETARNAVSTAVGIGRWRENPEPITDIDDIDGDEGDSALSRGAGNELMPESDSRLTDGDERDGARSKDRYAKRGKTKMHRL